MKKLLSLILVLALALGLSACTEEPRPDYKMLSERLAKTNENYKFEYFDMFIYDGAYQVYFSLCSENDILLSMHLDENGSIDDLTVTAYAKQLASEGERNAYRDFTSAVIDAYTQLTNSDTEEICSKMSFDDSNKYFSDLYETETCSRFNFIFSSNSEYIFTYCQYFEVMPDPTA